MLYCKVASDKSSEEIVEVVGIQSEEDGGGVTIYIPSLKRERDTELSRLSEIVEKKETLDTFFGKPKLELPKKNICVVYRRVDIPEMGTEFTSTFVNTYVSKTAMNNRPEHLFGDPYLGHIKELFVKCGANNDSKIFPDGTTMRVVYDWIDSIGVGKLNIGKQLNINCVTDADEVLLDNQRLLFNQLNSLKESLKVLSQKETSCKYIGRIIR